MKSSKALADELDLEASRLAGVASLTAHIGDSGDADALGVLRAVIDEANGRIVAIAQRLRGAER
jgi:hypothetical protein